MLVSNYLTGQNPERDKGKDKAAFSLYSCQKTLMNASASRSPPLGQQDHPLPILHQAQEKCTSVSAMPFSVEELGLL